MTNKEKFLGLVSNEISHTSEKIEWRRDNRLWLQKSRKIALKILSILDEKEMSQKDLADILNISPQQVSKWVKGKENFKLETISKIEAALDTTLINIAPEIETPQKLVTSKTNSPSAAPHSYPETIL